MTKSAKRSLNELLQDILGSAQRIKRYMANVTFDDFLVLEEKQDAVIRNIEIIGEAAASIKQNHSEFYEECPDIPLQKAYRMRNALIHGYFIVDPQIVWQTVESDIPVLEVKVSQTISNLEKGDSPCPPAP